MINYYIYHIPGIKIGCSMKPNRRVKSQGYETYEILEIHNDIDIASKREVELQKQYGYIIDTGANVYKKEFVDMGKKAGNLSVTNGHIFNIQKNAAEICKKKIEVYKNNLLIGKYNSLTDASKQLKLSISKISSVLSGDRKHHKNYTFKLI